MSTFSLARALTMLAIIFPFFASAENPQWLWHNNNGSPTKPNEVRYFRKTFRLTSLPTKALLTVAVDDEARVYINGKQVADTRGYEHPSSDEITRHLQKGANVIAIRARNNAGDIAGIIAMLELRMARGKTEFLVSNPTWRSAGKEKDGWNEVEFNDGAWSQA